MFIRRRYDQGVHNTNDVIRRVSGRRHLIRVGIVREVDLACTREAFGSHMHSMTRDVRFFDPSDLASTGIARVEVSCCSFALELLKKMRPVLDADGH